MSSYTLSLPTKITTFIDVPDKNLDLEFIYNHWTIDESTNEENAFDQKKIDKLIADKKINNNNTDESYIRYFSKASPRSIKVKWDKATNIINNNNQQTIIDLKFYYDKIIDEKLLSGDHFVTLNLNNQRFDEKLHFLVSSSFSYRNYVNNVNDLNTVTTKYVTADFLSKSFNKKYNGFSFNNEISSHQFDKVNSRVQIYDKDINSIIKNAILDPNSPYDIELSSYLNSGKQYETNDIIINNISWNSTLPYIEEYDDLESFATPVEAVGYIIEKYENISEKSSITHKDTFFIENVNLTSLLDVKIKYNAEYTYLLKSVYAVMLPIYDKNENLKWRKLLISHTPVYKSIKTIENVAPPVPSDINFTWDYAKINPLTADYDHITGQPIPGTGRRGSLLVHWSMPTNTQRDIKKFQIFRRKDIDQPFELIKMYDFDDSNVKFPNKEELIDPNLVEFSKNPITYHYDDEFISGQGKYQQIIGDLNIIPNPNEIGTWSSSYIYAISSIDAHGLSSGYSSQFQVWYDPFKNKLEKKLISKAGAPKQYPNLMLEKDLFVDMMKISGNFSKQCKLYFTPECYSVAKNSGNKIPLIEKEYKLQFINTDNQKSEIVNVKITDNRQKNNDNW